MIIQEVLNPTAVTEHIVGKTTPNLTSKSCQMKASTISIVLALVFSFSLSAQTTATWQGGKPGRTNDWNCSANWSNGRIPDEFTQVIIPSSVKYFPVIQSAPGPIDALLLEDGTLLTIQDGAKLTILCETGIFDGVIVLGQIRNNGTININKDAAIDLAFLQQVKGNGIVILPPSGTNTLAKR
jgi:hypothetical protein